MLTPSDIVGFRLAPKRRKRVLCLVACGKAKSNYPREARALYTSPLFRLSFRVAEAIGGETYIISAKHGIVGPETVIDPYDVTFASLSAEQKVAWRKNVASVLSTSARRKDRVIVFGGSSYLNEVKLAMPGTEVEDALGGQSLGLRLQHLLALNSVLLREGAIASLYESFGEQWRVKRFDPLSNLSSVELPRRGIYVFFDPSETTTYSRTIPRIVRVGTHAVSVGSSSTLRTRLRAHFGVKEGGGNHRSSIFRLHVGAALLARDELAGDLPSWGRGQSAPSAIREPEEGQEKKVSDYLRRLLVFTREIDDTPSNSSLRAVVERALISTLAGNGGTLDPPSAQWLGHYSPSKSISTSGLWNIQHVGKDFSEGETTLALNILSKSPGELI